jgi:hypothetical protein
MNRIASRMRAGLIAAGLMIAGPTVADDHDAPAGQADASARASHKAHNRFYRPDRPRETAEFARFEDAVAADEATPMQRRAPHKAHNRYHNLR